MTAASTTVQIPAAGTYRIEPATSKIAFSTKHMFGTGTVKGSFSLTSGEIVVTGPGPALRVTASASAHSFESANPKRDAQVKSKSFLHADAHPQILFQSSELIQDAGQWVLRGEISARGTSAPVDLTVVESEVDATGLTLHATGKVDRYAHGITKMKGLAGRYLTLDITARAARS